MSLHRSLKSYIKGLDEKQLQEIITLAQGILGSNLNISRLEEHIKENRF